VQPNWDDLRILLAVWRGGSARGAAEQLNISHATISRRVDAIEKRLGIKAFDRLPSGYCITQDGEELLHAAEIVEAEIDSAQRRLSGRDQRLAGVIRLTTMDIVATHFLMPWLAEFSERYPQTEIELTVGYQSLNLNRREADVALRGITNPPEHLIGQRVATVAYGAYATDDYLSSHSIKENGNARWIGFGTRTPKPAWLKSSPLPHLPSWGLFDELPVQVEAARAGLGIAYLPCFAAANINGLVPVTDTTVKRHDLWLLRHKDTRSTARLRVFAKFLAEIFRDHQDLFDPQSLGDREPGHP